jgi:hypothetical protein
VPPPAAQTSALAFGVVLTGAVILATGWHWLDPAAGLVISAVILLGTWGAAARLGQPGPRRGADREQAQLRIAQARLVERQPAPPTTIAGIMTRVISSRWRRKCPWWPACGDNPCFGEVVEVAMAFCLLRDKGRARRVEPQACRNRDANASSVAKAWQSQRAVRQLRGNRESILSGRGG